MGTIFLQIFIILIRNYKFSSAIGFVMKSKARGKQITLNDCNRNNPSPEEEASRSRSAASYREMLNDVNISDSEDERSDESALIEIIEEAEKSNSETRQMDNSEKTNYYGYCSKITDSDLSRLQIDAQKLLNGSNDLGSTLYSRLRGEKLPMYQKTTPKNSSASGRVDKFGDSIVSILQAKPVKDAVTNKDQKNRQIETNPDDEMEELKKRRKRSKKNREPEEGLAANRNLEPDEDLAANRSAVVGAAKSLGKEIAKALSDDESNCRQFQGGRKLISDRYATDKKHAVIYIEKQGRFVVTENHVCVLTHKYWDFEIKGGVLMKQQC